MDDLAPEEAQIDDVPLEVDIESSSVSTVVLPLTTPTYAQVAAGRTRSPSLISNLTFSASPLSSSSSPAQSVRSSILCNE
jgi:hypothetical protein